MRSKRGLVCGVVTALVLAVMQVPASIAPVATPAGPGEKISLTDLARNFVGGRAAAPKPVPAGDGVARDDPAPGGKARPPATRIRELTARRTTNAKFYQLSDGRVQAEISRSPVHYADDRDVLRPIDTTITGSSRTGFRYGNTTNTFTSLFGASTEQLLRLEYDGRYVQLGLPGRPAALAPRVSGSTVTYPGAAIGADLMYDVTPLEVKDKIVLTKPPVGGAGFTLEFTLDTGGVQPVARADGSIAFVPPDGGEPAFVMPAPYMYDAGPDTSSPVGKGFSDKVTRRSPATAAPPGSRCAPTPAGWPTRPVPTRSSSTRPSRSSRCRPTDRTSRSTRATRPATTTTRTS